MESSSVAINNTTLRVWWGFLLEEHLDSRMANKSLLSEVAYGDFKARLLQSGKKREIWHNNLALFSSDRGRECKNFNFNK